MYKHKLYLIENKTALHVGSGESNFGIIDNQIQRDAITKYPTIHSSSLKGALREYCTHRHSEEESKNFLDYIFGSQEQSGKVRFIDAHLLSVPMRADLNPYYHCVSPQSITNFLEFCETFGIEIEHKEELAKIANAKETAIVVKEGKPTIEDEEAQNSTAYNFEALEQLVGSPVSIVPNSIFEAFTHDLPVIARNQLENGESKNLFYEEVLPRKSKFFTVITEPTYLHHQDAKKLENAFDRFGSYLTDENTIHIGANASIGYGVCSFKEIPCVNE